MSVSLFAKSTNDTSCFRLLNRNKKGLLAGLLIFSLAACARQAPAPVVNGTVSAQPPVIIQTPEPVIIEPEPIIGGQIEPGTPARIAILVPLSHQAPNVQALAKSIVDAVKLSATDIGDPLIQIGVYDTAGDPTRAAEAAYQAAEEGAHLFVGPLFSSSVAAIQPVATEFGLNIIGFSTDANVAGDNTYLIGFLPDQEIQRIFDFASSRGLKRIAGLTPQTPYGQLVISASHQAAARSGSRVMKMVRYVQDFQGIELGVRKFAKYYKSKKGERGVEAVFLPDSGQALQTLGAFLAYNDVSPTHVKYIGVGGWDNPATLKESALKGGWFAAPDPRVRKRFNDRFASVYGNVPPALAGLGYDAMAAVGAMLSEARGIGNSFPFEKAAITDPAGFVGVNGIFRFMPNGLNQRGLAIMQVGNRGFSVIDAAPSSFGDFGF